MHSFDKNMDIVNDFVAYGNTLEGAEVYYRESWDCYYFSLLGKCFGMLGDTFITLKGNPETNLEMRKAYDCVKPGYHVNKRHWVSVDLVNHELSHEIMNQLIRTSYHLVFDGLTNKQRLSIADKQKENHIL